MLKSRAKTLAIKAMAHQVESIKHDATHPEVFDLSDPGTGKTFVRVACFASRRRAGGGCALVLAPRSLLRTAWANDFARFAPDMRVSVANSANRAAAFAAEADAYVTNHDAVKELLKLPATYWHKFSEIIVDESPAFKHHTSQRSKALGKLIRMKIGAKKRVFTQRKLLTATPTSNGICDIWHQAYLLDDGQRLGPNFYGFRSSVCSGKQVAASAHAIQWTDKPGAEEAVFGILSEIVVRHRFEDCVDIPDTHIYSMDYALPPKQRKVYDEMALHQLFTAGNNSITAVQAAALATKLLQISSGAVYDGSGKYVVIDTERYETIIELASHRKHPLVLFFWAHQKELLCAEATKRGLSHCVLDGAASDMSRARMVQDYQAGRYDIMFGHPQIVAHGLTLTRGTSIIWPGPTYNLEWLKQANKRQARIGQAEKTEVITLIAPGTIEEKVYQISQNKDGRMSNLLDLFASMSAAPTATKVARKLVVV